MVSPVAVLIKYNNVKLAYIHVLGHIGIQVVEVGFDKFFGTIVSLL